MAGNSCRNRRWKNLIHLTKLLSEGKVELEEPVSQPKSPNALVHGFLKKRKRSPRNNNTNISKKKPAGPRIIIKQKHKNPNSRNPSFALACQNRCFEAGESSKVVSKYKLLMKRQIINNIPNVQQPPLPGALERRIVESGGHLESAVVLIDKELYPTDLSRKHCRMSVPIRQVRERFLLPEEVEFLCSGGKIRTVIIPPSLDECKISFSLWKSNTTYVLMTGWKNVWIKNEFRDYMPVRLWAFRRNSDLCFALEKME